MRQPRKRARRRAARARTGPSLVRRLHAEVTGLLGMASSPVADRRMTQLQGELFGATARLAAAPSASAADIDAKLVILCARLREFLHPDQRGELLTYLLAESIREDHRLLSHAATQLETDDA